MLWAEQGRVRRTADPAHCRRRGQRMPYLKSNQNARAGAWAAWRRLC